MRNEKELAKALGKLLHEARTAAGMSISAVAEALDKDDKTYANWERGKSSPSLPMAIRCFEVMRQPIMHPLMNYFYPEEFGTLNNDSDPDAIRNALNIYLNEIATDDEVRKIAYLVFGEHGSSWKHQLEGFCALDHLPMYARVMVAQTILTNYELMELRGQLIHTECVMPNIEVFKKGYHLGKNAAVLYENKYNVTE